MLVQASKAIDNQLQQLTEKLESHIDPFDLDVFSPYIYNHLTRQTQRSNVRRFAPQARIVAEWSHAGNMTVPWRTLEFSADKF